MCRLHHLEKRKAIAHLNGLIEMVYFSPKYHTLKSGHMVYPRITVLDSEVSRESRRHCT